MEHRHLPGNFDAGKRKTVEQVDKNEATDKLTGTTESLDPLISVIVPIYNVGKYVRKCLDSLRGQTLREIEIICIDDGSTDESGKIADEYESQEFPIIRVIHTENRGLSAVRNLGIDESRAEWLMFVDSDDWVSEEFCRIPYAAAIESQADFVEFGLYKVSRWGTIMKYKYDGPTDILDNMIAQEHIVSVAWNKLYKKVLFDGIRYPEGRVYEDIATTYKLVHKAKHIIVIKDRLYFHQRRKNSITQLKSAKGKRDAAISAWEKYCGLREYGYPENKLKGIACSSAIGILANTEKGNNAYIEAEKIIASTRGIPKSISLRKKIAIVIWKVDPNLFHLICQMVKRMVI